MDSATTAQRLDRLLRETRPAPMARAVCTGVPGVDRVLGKGGVPVGQITEWVGARSSGKSGVLRTLVAAVRRQGMAVAWVDARRELMAADWVDPGAMAPLWVVRPPIVADAAFCAEVLLRTQCFGLVVLDGGPALPSSVGVRLQRMARQSAAALIVVRAPDARPSRSVARRVAFEAACPPPSADPLAARAPLVWPVDMARSRGGAQADARVHLVEPNPDRLTAYASGPDRPSTRTRAGARYGI